MKPEGFGCSFAPTLEQFDKSPRVVPYEPTIHKLSDDKAHKAYCYTECSTPGYIHNYDHSTNAYLWLQVPVCSKCMSECSCVAVFEAVTYSDETAQDEIWYSPTSYEFCGIYRKNTLKEAGLLSDHPFYKVPADVDSTERSMGYVKSHVNIKEL